MDQSFRGHETYDVMADPWHMLKIFLFVVAVVAVIFAVACVFLMVVELHLLREELQEFRSVQYARSAMIRHDIALLQHVVETRFGVTWDTWLPATTLGPEWRAFYSDRDDRMYYHNTHTHVSQWDFPGVGLGPTVLPPPRNPPVAPPQPRPPPAPPAIPIAPLRSRVPWARRARGA